MEDYKDFPSSGSELLRDVLTNRGWRVRDGQKNMVSVLDDCFDDDSGSQTVSAPTGTGKSLANLCSALAAGNGIVYATSTKALQNQLRQTELPNLAKDIRDVYGMSLTYAVLKGKDNYPCIHALSTMASAGDGLMEASGEQAVINAMYEKVTTNIDEGNFGELDCEDELAQLSPDTRAKLLSSKCHKVNSVWAQSIFDSMSDDVLVTPDEVLNKDWRREPVCTYTYALAYAMLADIVVTNTALLVADLNHNTGSSPVEVAQSRCFVVGRKTVIIDEAHHASSIVASSMSSEINFAEYAKVTKELAGKIKKSSTGCYKAANDAAGAFKEYDARLREVAPVKDADENVREELKGILEATSDTVTALAHDIGSEIRNGNATLEYASAFWMDYMESEDTGNINPTIAAMSKKFTGRDDFVYDVTVNLNEDTGACTTNAVPLDVSFFGSKLMGVMNTVSARYTFGRVPKNAHIIACSATIQGNLYKALGLPNCYHDVVESPFYAKRARLWVPSESTVPSPPKNWRDVEAKEARNNAVCANTVDVVNAAGGRTIVLTTSTATAHMLTDYLRQHVDVRVLSQFEGSRADNMDAFAQDETSVFVGTVGYWEGVDIPGRALSAVVIDKILFPHPGDPVSEARRKYVERNGGKAFQEVSVEHASTMIAQGFGRLVRSVDDAGLVAILDPRVSDAWYGSKVLSKIDRGTPVTRSKEVALRWLSECVSETADVDNVDGWVRIGKKPVRPGKRSAGKIKFNK